MRLNEGKCDPRGRFWVTSMENNMTDGLIARSQDMACGRLFRIDGKSVTACSEAGWHSKYNGVVTRLQKVLSWRLTEEHHLGLGL